MQDLSGKATFTEEQISAMKSALDSYGIPMPQFKRIGGILAEEMPVDEAAFHAAILAINKALDGQDFKVTLIALQNPNACLIDIGNVQLWLTFTSQKNHEKIRETLFTFKLHSA